MKTNQERGKINSPRDPSKNSYKEIIGIFQALSVKKDQGEILIFDLCTKLWTGPFSSTGIFGISNTSYERPRY